jgi:hypothetical protein
MALPRIMGVGELDEICAKLLSAFVIEDKSYRFSEFQEFLEIKGLEISEPTLILHLKHLVEKGVLIRSEKDKQFVTYRFDREKWQNATRLVRDRVLAEKALQQEMDEFSKTTVFEQISYVNVIAVTMFLVGLREQVLAKIKPEAEFVANINLNYFSNIINRAMNMILDNVDKKGDKYAVECLYTIDKLIKLYSEAKHEYEDFQTSEIPTIEISNETNDLLDKIFSHVNENAKPEDYVLRPDIVHKALEDYAKKTQIE